MYSSHFHLEKQIGWNLRFCFPISLRGNLKPAGLSGGGGGGPPNTSKCALNAYVGGSAADYAMNDKFNIH